MYRLSQKWFRLAPLAVFAAAGTAYAADDNPVGVYVWGNNSHRLISQDPSVGRSASSQNLPSGSAGAAAPPAAVRSPVRVPYFDNKKLRDLAICPVGAIAVDAKGNVVQWTSPDNQHVVLKGKDIVSVRFAGTRPVALAANGTVYTWPLDETSKPIQFSLAEPLKWFEKVVSIDAGQSHIAARTNKGRVFTGLTTHLEKHDGQLGQAAFSAFDPAPPAGVLRAVKLLPPSVTSVACGNQHTVACTSDGEVYGWGSNVFGQLMQPFTFKNMQISVPSVMPSNKPGGIGKVDHVCAGGDVTYLTTADNGTYAIGNGIYGQLGTGSLAHCQTTPLRLPALDELQEFNEKTNRSEKLVPSDWNVGSSHTFLKLAPKGAKSGNTGSWLEWGSSDVGQLGTGKGGKILKPLSVQQTGLGETITGDALVAGNGVSACFTRA